MYNQTSQSEYFRAVLLAGSENPRIIENTSPTVEAPTNGDYYLHDDKLSGFFLVRIPTSNINYDSGSIDLRGVFSAKKGRGYFLMLWALGLGANTLDCFDGYLTEFYAWHGFVEVKREPKVNLPDVVYMQHCVPCTDKSNIH